MSVLPSVARRRGHSVGDSTSVGQRFQILRPHATGGLGAVLIARDGELNRDVALKVVEPRVEEEFGRRAIEREARIAGRLSHPNIVALRNADWIDGHFVLATDLARRSLAGYAGARRSPRIALEVIRQVAAGLAHAHSRRVLHLDLKPENILIFPDGRAAIADFGTSRLARGHDLEACARMVRPHRACEHLVPSGFRLSVRRRQLRRVRRQR